MNIAVLGINYYPELTGIGVYNTDVCEYLASKGHDITVFTSFPYYPFGSDYSSWYKEKNIPQSATVLDENINGVRVKRCNIYKPSKPRTLGRILQEVSFLKAMFTRTNADREDYDLVICVSPPFLLGLAGISFSKRKKASLIVHVQDLQIDAARELGMIKNKALLSLLSAIEYRIFLKADFITTISEAMKHAIIKKGVEEKKVDMLYNWADPANIIPLDRNNAFSRRHHLDNKFVILHAGNMGEKQDIHIILEAAKAMKGEDDIRFLLVGRGSKRATTERYVKRYALTNVIILDAQPKETVNEMFSACDVALIAQDRNVRNCVMPSKVFGPACAAKPIIIASHDSCEIFRLAQAHQFGILIPPGDAAALVAAIYHLKESRTLADTLGRNGRHFMVQYRHLEKILEQFEEKITNKYIYRRQ